MDKKKFHIVLFAPEIPGNTGSIGRTCVALDIPLILIKPYGFDINEKSVRRAGLDYWKYLQLKEYNDWDDFLKNEKPQEKEMFFFSRKAGTNYLKADFTSECYLIFGSETKGLPGFLRDDYPNQFVYMPMFSEHIRSLNLSNVATAAAYECLRQLN